MIGLDVEIQTLGLGVIRGLDLNGDQLAFPLDDKIHFCAALGLPVIGVVAVDGQLHLDVIFCHAALEIVQFFHHIENIVGQQVFFGAEQAQVRDIDLEGVNISVIFQGFLHFFHPVDL